MKKKTVENDGGVQVQKTEKIGIEHHAALRRHSRVLYVPLEAITVRMYRLKKGDVVKYRLLELRRAPPEEIAEREKD